MKARRILILIPVIILAMALSGCVQTVVSLDIKEDLSAAVDIKMGIEQDYYDMAGGDEAFSGMNTGNMEDATTSTYTEDGYKGIQTTGTVSDITDSDCFLTDMFGDDFIEVETVDGKDTIQFHAPVANVAGHVSGQTGYSLSELSNYGKVDMRIVITFPYNIEESNATSVSGRTLTWDLLTFEGDEMYATSKNAGFVFPVWIIIIIVAAAAAVVVFFLLRMKKNKGVQNPSYHYADMQNGPVQPGTQQPMYNTAQQPMYNTAQTAQQAGYNTAQTAQQAGYTVPVQQQVVDAEPSEKPVEQPEADVQVEEQIIDVQPTEQPAAEEQIIDVQPTEQPAADVQPEENINEQPSEQPAVDTETVLPMLFCPQCGHKLTGSGLFCPQCGHRLQ